MCVTIHVNSPTVAITVHAAVAETVAVAVAVTERKTMGSSAKLMITKCVTEFQLHNLG